MKRKWLMVCVILIVALALCACGRQESPVEDFEYEMVNGEVIITGYKGTDQEIYIPAVINDRPVTRIDNVAFKGYDLTLVDIPEGVVEIGKSAFTECACLETVVFSNSLETIEDWAFYDCVALENVGLPQNLKSLGSSVFYGCEKMKEIVIPDNFTGFVVHYDLMSAKVDDEGNVSFTYIDKMSSPVGDGTVLVVKAGSEAERMLELYGHGEIEYKVK